MRILCFGTYERRRQPRMVVLREGFEASGDEVLECNEPLSLDTSLRVEMLRKPWLLPILGARVLVTWTRLLRRARCLPRVDAVVVGYMGHFDVHLARRIWPRTPIVLDHMISARDTALDRGIANPRLLRILDRVDRAAVRAADLPLVDTEEHLDLLAPDARSRAMVVPVGAPERCFRGPAQQHEPPLRVIFFGLFTPLQGAPAIGEAIGLLADAGISIRFTMVGDGQDYERTRRAAAGNPKVLWLGWTDPERIPDLLAEHDVCLGIFGTTQKGRRVVPHKVYEGAAAGCAIVTSDTPPQRRALGGAAVFVPPGDAKELAAALRALAADPERVRALRESARRLADESFRGAAVVGPLRARLAMTARR